MKRAKRRVKKLKGHGFLRQHFPKVTEVVDATKGVRVTIKQRDTIEGRKNQPTECAMAKAMRRDFDADGVVIGMSYSYLIKGERATRYKTPPSVAREITSFDRHQDFAPGEYGLGPISPSQRLGHRSSGSSGPRSHPVVHKRTVRVRTMK
jgi:hypothetical protein